MRALGASRASLFSSRIASFAAVKTSLHGSSIRLPFVGSFRNSRYATLCSVLHASVKVSRQVPTASSTYAKTTRHFATLRASLTDSPREEAGITNGFAKLGMNEGLLQALQLVGFTDPTEIQERAFPAVMSGTDVLLASHTGSGKTLAYLLPLIQLLKDEEAEAGELLTRPKRPRAIILGPTRELTDQVLSVAKSLSHKARFSSAVVNGGVPPSRGKSALAQPVDILVGTPQRILQHHKEGHLFFGDVRYIVLDEADTMFDQGFGKEVREVLRPIRTKEGSAVAVLVAATLTKDVRKLLDSEFPDMRKVDTSSLHRAAATARHDFHKLPPGRDRLGFLYELTQAPVSKGKRVIVFCNTMDSARAVEHFLSERQMATVCYHGDVPINERAAAMKAFLEGREDGRQPVMVCTDLAARGLDFKAGVDQVFNFDFPKTVVDYIHRTGRTARAGRVGFVSSIVDPKAATLANRIQFAVERGLPLDEISADPKKLPPSQRPSEKTKERKFQEKKQRSKKGLRGAARHEEREPPPRRGSAPSPRGQAGRKGAPQGGRGRGAPPQGGPVRGGPRQGGRGRGRSPQGGRGGPRR